MKRLFIAVILMLSASSYAKQAKIKCFSITGENFQEHHIDFIDTNLKRYPSDNFAYEIKGRFIEKVTNGVRPPFWQIQDAVLSDNVQEEMQSLRERFPCTEKYRFSRIKSISCSALSTLEILPKELEVKAESPTECF